MASTEDLPGDLPESAESALKRAWARALRHPNEPIESHDDPRVVPLPGGLVAQIGLDWREEGRFARVSVNRPQGPPITHEEAVPVVAQVFLLGRFEPFPVDCVVGADGATLHYVIDVEAYKEARAQDHVAEAARRTGASGGGRDPETGARGAGLSEAEIAAIAWKIPFYELARTADLNKLSRRDGRTLMYLSDRFLVPRRWIDFQVDLFLRELADGNIDERGVPDDGTGGRTR